MARVENYKITSEIWKNTSVAIKITKSMPFRFRYWFGVKIVNLGFWIVGVPCRVEDESKK